MRSPSAELAPVTHPKSSVDTEKSSSAIASKDLARVQARVDAWESSEAQSLRQRCREGKLWKRYGGMTSCRRELQEQDRQELEWAKLELDLARELRQTPTHEGLTATPVPDANQGPNFGMALGTGSEKVKPVTDEYRPDTNFVKVGEPVKPAEPVTPKAVEAAKASEIPKAGVVETSTENASSKLAPLPTPSDAIVESKAQNAALSKPSPAAPGVSKTPILLPATESTPEAAPEIAKVPATPPATNPANPSPMPKDNKPSVATPPAETNPAVVPGAVKSAPSSDAKAATPVSPETPAAATSQEVPAETKASGVEAPKTESEEQRAR
jgi:hypothetical protein